MSKRDTADETRSLSEGGNEGGQDRATSVTTSLDGGRFVAGTILDARYRIVGLLGRGGMGEVYRADDLKLGEPVALKFLPESLSHDAAALARLHREVRTARSIAHPNVVRVYDIGEQDGQAFLSMEYVDGEDLSILIKRIGRLPSKKATQLARQICAGLAAAHRVGVVHRDLKPANVMVDSEGNAKINDFGLAAAAEDLEGGQLAGTPAYMAPEQLAQGKASFASDIYALGLVLYEMYTGERPYRADSPDKLLERQRSQELSPLTTHVRELDPQVEGAILSCLAAEPEQRPASPLEVTARLPGGDLLAAALAAGETPSPEMLERADVDGALSRPVGWALLGIIGLSMVVAAWLTPQQSILGFDGVPLAPKVLEYRANTILTSLDWPDSAGSGVLLQNRQFRDFWRAQKHTAEEWRLRAAEGHSLIDYWYRCGVDGVEPKRRWGTFVTPNDPPLTTPGIATVRLDSRGRLLEMYLPPDLDQISEAGATDWLPLFEFAELNPEDFTAVAPSKAPPYYATELFSWVGHYPQQNLPEVRIDAASIGHRIVFWRLSDTVAAPSAEPARSPVAVAVSVFAGILVLGGWLAWRNFRQNRGDRRGALRLALFTVVAHLTSLMLLILAHTPQITLSLILSQVAEALFLGAAVWVMYIAIEPLFRRFIPGLFVAWSRLLAGQFRDPLVGRDLLIGLATAAGLTTALQLIKAWRLNAGGDSLIADFPHGLNPLHGPIPVVANLLTFVQWTIPLALMFLFVLPRPFIRRPGPAAVVGAGIIIAFGVAAGGLSVDSTLRVVALAIVAASVGMLGLIGTSLWMSNMVLTPVAADPAIWWAPTSWISLAMVAAVAWFSFKIATASRNRVKPQSSEIDP